MILVHHQGIMLHFISKIWDSQLTKRQPVAAAATQQYFALIAPWEPGLKRTLVNLPLLTFLVHEVGIGQHSVVPIIEVKHLKFESALSIDC